MCLKIIEWQTSVGKNQQIKKTKQKKPDLVYDILKLGV
jgi:hypothetical protein